MRAIVTGGAGFIGSNLVDRLIHDGHQVTALDNFVSGNRSNVNPKAHLILDDVSHPATLLFDLEKPDVIFHLAAQPRHRVGFKEPVYTISNNVMGTLNVLEFARRFNVRVVYASSPAASRDPYAYSKGSGEEMCKAYSNAFGVETAIARIFSTYGPGHLGIGRYATVVAIFEKQCRAGRPLTVTGDGLQRRDLVHVWDVVSGLVAMATANWYGQAETFDLGTGRSYAILDVAEMFSTNIKWIPARPSEAREERADIFKSMRLLGYEPSVRLEEYVSGWAQEAGK